jgi:hypothetical protein
VGPYRTAAVIPNEVVLAPLVCEAPAEDDEGIFVPVVSRSESHAIFGEVEISERDVLKGYVLVVVSVVAFICIWIFCGTQP